MKRLTTIKLENKPKSIHLVLGNQGELRVAVTLANNTIELYTISTAVKNGEAKCLRSIKNQGHRSEIRTVSFSSDNLAIVSGSGESIKLWNRPSQTCLRTVETGYVVCICNFNYNAFLKVIVKCRNVVEIFLKFQIKIIVYVILSNLLF